MIICEIIVHLLVIVQNNGRSRIICEIIVLLLVIVQNNGRIMIICEIIVHLLVIVQNNNKTVCNIIPCHSHYIFVNMFPLSLGHHQEDVLQGIWHKLHERTQSLRVQLKLPCNYSVLCYCVSTYVGKYTRNFESFNKFKHTSTSVAKCIPYYQKF